MFGLHLKKVFCQAVNSSRCYFGRHFGLCHRSFKTASYLPWSTIGWTRIGLLAVDIKPYSTTEEDVSTKPTKKVNYNARKVIGHIGRLIPYNIIQVLDKEGKGMGTMLKKDVIRIMEKENLKLISVSENTAPPVYKLLTGQQLHEEKMKRREKQKRSPGPVQIRDMAFSSNIAKHDLDVKRKQLIHWIEKKHNVRITVLNSRSVNGPDRLVVLQQMIESIMDCATYMVEPKERQDGQAVICVLRPLSNKERQKSREVRPALEKRGDTAPTEDTSTKDTHSPVS